MKYNFFLVIFTISMLTSCGTEYFEEDNSKYNITSNETNMKLISFNVNSDVTVETKADAKTKLSDFFSYLQYWIFDEEYLNIKASGTQKSTDSNFGTFSANLRNDSTYHVVVIGHNNKKEMEMGTGNVLKLSSSDSYNTETYYGNTECKVTSGGADNTSISLEKNVCFLKVVNVGKLSNVGAILFSVNAFGSDFFASTGFSGTDKATIDAKFTLTDSNRELERPAIAICFPLPNAEENTDVSFSVTLYALDGTTVLNDTVKKFTNVPAKAGRKVTYTGTLLESTENFTVELPEDSWEIKNITY